MKHFAIATCLVFSALPTATLGESPPVRQCKFYVQGRIDVLDAELHKGTKPDQARKLVKRRDRLRAQLAACEHNPKAYEKDI
jgi:hypothetical protein